MDFILLFVPQPTQITDSPHRDKRLRHNQLPGMFVVISLYIYILIPIKSSGFNSDNVFLTLTPLFFF